MATSKDRWLADAIGTMRSAWRINSLRLKDTSGVLQVRNSGDSADANLKASGLQLSGISAAAGYILQVDASGNVTAVAAGAGVAASVNKDVEMFADSAVITVGTPTISAGTQYRYNYVRFTTVVGANWKWQFVADLSLGATITVLYEQGTGQATVDLKINGTTVASKDFSSGGTVNNQTWTATLGTSVHGAGRHTLELVSGGSGSVGAAFAISLHKVWINAT